MVASDHPFVTYILDGKNNEKGWLLHHHREAVVDSKDKVPKGRKKSPSEISFIVMQYFMIKSLPRTYKLGLVTSFCHAWGMSVSGLKKLVSNYVMSLGTNVFSERKDKYDSVFNSEKKRKEAFSPYNIFKKRRRREHYSYYNEYLESKELKKEWEKIEKNNDTKKIYVKLHEEYMSSGHLLHHNLITILKYLNASVTWRDLASLLNHEMISHNTIKKHVMTLDGFKYRSDRVIPLMDKITIHIRY